MVSALFLPLRLKKIMSFCNSLAIQATNRTNIKKIMRRRTVFGIIFIVAGLLKLADMWNIVRLEWLKRPLPIGDDGKRIV